LYLADPEFQVQSRTRLEAGCPIDASDLLSMTGPERHSAAGPAGAGERSAKAAATLLHLLQIASPVPGWVEHVRGSEGMQALLAQDIDASQTIADKWLHRIREITGRAK
jgi:hypothetical protein